MAQMRTASLCLLHLPVDWSMWLAAIGQPCEASTAEDAINTSMVETVTSKTKDSTHTSIVSDY